MTYISLYLILAPLRTLTCWLAWWQVGDHSILLVQISRECTLSYLSTGISNLLRSTQAEVVLGQLSRYLASWVQSATYIYGFFNPYWKTRSFICVCKLFPFSAMNFTQAAKR
jgi:hypothetical protein